MSAVVGPVAAVAPGVMKGLKDFQRKTVDYVFDRLYDPTSSRRFLVADEVGLGKTLIAKGVIAKAIDHLRDKVDRIDVLYICSNGDIARQNLHRLKVGDADYVPMASRLTMLARDSQRLNASKLNFISFTPTTSFDVQGGLGQVHERVLLYCMLREAWKLGVGKAPMNVFQGHVKADRFRWLVGQSEGEVLDKSATDAFCAGLAARLDREAKAGTPTLRDRFDALCGAYSRADKAVPAEMNRERYRFVGELRAVLAASCVNTLEPDLIVLDEFQRFSHLLEGEDDASRLARELFEFKDVRVLMLSATPYKMYTTADEASGEDHYKDFVRTLRFLEGTASAGSVESTVAAYREALLQVGDAGAHERIAEARKALETRLSHVMVRTERLAATTDRNGMLSEVPARRLEVKAEDLQNYLAVQRVATDVQAGETLELWKSAPFLLNFVDDGYQLRHKLSAAIEVGDSRQRLARSLATSPAALFPWPQAEAYARIDPGNARMRALIADVVDSGAYKLLWLPPSLPYYRLDGAYGAPGVATFTKRLVFSSWRMVPRAIAAMVSYEVERRMVEGDPEARNTAEGRKQRRPLLRFTITGGRLTGMPVLALLYPSLYLAKACDPAELLRERAREHDDGGAGATDAVSLADVLEIARGRIQVGLERLRVPEKTEGAVDEQWYWAAPLLLDKALDPKATQAWFDQADLAAAWSGATEEEEAVDPDEEPGQRRTTNRPPPEEGDSWQKHVDRARAVAKEGAGPNGNYAGFGRMPEDLVEVLAELAVAGPAVAMFRALDRVVSSKGHVTPTEAMTLRNGAGRTAWSFRALFNQPEVTAMLRGGVRGVAETPYWRQVLTYCAEGCLPAVLDEYVHVLRDHLGLMNAGVGDRVHEIADEMRAAVELRTSRVGIDNLSLSDAGGTLRRDPKNLRTHYALRFADDSNEEGNVITRADQVRKAFNSPFWPFVLATTSVGQEGLDFHTYCHAVVHWNLPSNPVDLEQREGRVHRYKGHAVRRNVARRHGWAALQSEQRDFWDAMFASARIEASANGESEIVPFWVYPVEGGARIERHILSLPMSREHGQAARLRRSLAVYRMVFGQPRQEDLVRYLEGRIPPEALERVLAAARIELGPR